MKKAGKRILRGVFIGVIALSLILGIFVGFSAIYAKTKIDFSRDERLFFLAKSGTVTHYYADGGAGGEYLPVEISAAAPGEVDKQWYALEDIAPAVRYGFIAAEDRGFEHHHGVDLRRTLMAAGNYLRHGKGFGASTITQQVIKNISGDSETTLRRKYAEILRALHLEKHHTKEEILEVYLNIVPMGENLVGVGRASEVYFGKLPGELTVAEAATLVGITNAPSRYNPHLHPEECRTKRNTVLSCMLQCGYIDEETWKQETARPLTVAERPGEEERVNSWFLETVNEEIVNDLCRRAGYSPAAARALLLGGGLTVYTTENPAIQNILESYFENPANLPAQVENGLNFAMVVCDSRSGVLRGIIGQCGKKKGNLFINHATVPHTPGSALKPLALYAPLIDEGKITWATVLDDVPLSFSQSGGIPREYPRNYPAVYDGLMTVGDALRLSKNTIALRLYGMRGGEQIYHDLTQTFGFDTILRQGTGQKGERLTDIAAAPLGLGQLSRGVSLRKLTEAYTVFPGEGMWHRGKSYLTVYDGAGNLLLDNREEEGRQVYSAACAAVMNQMLSGVTRSGTARSLTLKKTVPTAGKTGTSGEDRDRLFIGYTPYYTAGIWCGYPETARGIGHLSKTHLSVWDEVMQKIHRLEYAGESTGRFSVDGVSYRPFCRDSGGLYMPTCALDARGGRMEYGYFIPGTEPMLPCDRHIVCLYDTETEALAGPDCPDVREVALVRVEDRAFPKEIIVTDAQYVYREMPPETKMGDSYDVPYFMFALPPDVYVGRSAGKKQFNSYCFLHEEE